MRSTRRNSRAPTALVAIVPLLAALALPGCPAPPNGPRYMGAGHEKPQHGGTFIFYHESGVRSLDPAMAFDELSGMAVKLLFNGLLDYDYHARLVPSLAASMPWVSEDGKTYRFRLRRGVKFHNGRELTAEDVRWSMERMLSPELGSPGYTFYSNIAGLDAYHKKKASHISGIRVLDRYTIEFTLKAPDQTFLNAIAMTFAYPIPKENVKKWGSQVSRHPIGTGPFELDSWEPGVRMTFKRNPHYFEPGKPYVDREIFLLNIPRQTAYMRFANGEIDSDHRFTVADYLTVLHSKKWKPYREQHPMVDLWGITMNCQLPPFDNVHLRRAVAYGIDRKRWAKARLFRIIPTGQPIPHGLLGWKADLAERQYYDPAKAKEEMRLAGYPHGLPQPVTLWNMDGGTSKVYGEMFQADMKKLGIDVRLKPVAFPVYLRETGKPRTAQMVYGGWNQDFPDPSDFLDILFATSAIHAHDSENRSFYSNPKVDDLLTRARVERDRTKRRALYEQASNILAHDAPWAFAFSDVQFEAWQPYVHNYRIHPVWAEYYANVWLDLPKRRIALLYGAGRPSRMAAIFPFGRALIGRGF